jgi:hypothetical protein
MSSKKISSNNSHVIVENERKNSKTSGNEKKSKDFWNKDEKAL